MSKNKLAHTKKKAKAKLKQAKPKTIKINNTVKLEGT